MYNIFVYIVIYRFARQRKAWGAGTCLGTENKPHVAYFTQRAVKVYLPLGNRQFFCCSISDSAIDSAIIRYSLASVVALIRRPYILMAGINIYYPIGLIFCTTVRAGTTAAA